MNKVLIKTFSPDVSRLIRLNVGATGILLLYEFLYLDLLPILPLGIVCFGGIIFVLTATSCLYIPFEVIERKNWGAFVLLLINGVMILTVIYLFEPIRYLRISTEFWIKSRGFEEIITLVENGDLQPDQFGQANLPKEYQYLSNDNKVHIYKENGVLYLSFDTNAAIVFPKAIYIYCSNGLPPNADIRERVYKINSYWYLVSYL